MDHQEQIAQFCGMTGASPQIAQTVLEASNWNLAQATQLYFDEQEGGEENEDEAPTSAPAPPAAATQATSSTAASSSARRVPQNNSRLRTLADIQASAHDDDDDDEERDPDMFAGGEKSGLAVQNPGNGRPTDHFRNILNQARANKERPPPAGSGEDEPAAGSGNFGGRAQTLGGDDVPSQVVDDPSASRPGRRARMETITRTLHLWRDGVSVDDGPLFRFDDPANERMMQQINEGHAPLSLLDVQPNQEVDLTLEPHKDQDYVQPKKKYKAFSGQGQRLGSPVPGVETAAQHTPAAAPDAPSTTSASTNSVSVDDSAPTVALQIRLGDGTRLSSRFNTTHTIGDVYTFVERAQANQRSYVLMTTFPSKELSDRSQSLGDLPEFKRGGVVVQKWT